MNPLKKYLNKNKESENAFAIRSGVSQATIWRIANIVGYKTIPKTARLISQATNSVITEMQILYPNDIRKN